MARAARRWRRAAAEEPASSDPARRRDAHDGGGALRPGAPDPVELEERGPLPAARRVLSPTARRRRALLRDDLPRADRRGEPGYHLRVAVDGAPADRCERRHHVGLAPRPVAGAGDLRWDGE